MKKQIVSALTAGFVAASLLFSLASCKQSDDITNITYAVEGASEESTNFKINKAWSVKNGVEDGTVVTRFYDGNEYIAYIGVRSILEEMYKFDMTEASYANGIYTYRMKNAFNQSFVLNVDVRKDTLHLSNYYEFINSFDKGIDASAKNNGKRPISVEEAHLGFKPVTLELAKYGLKIFGGVDDAYVPLSVFSALLWPSGKRFVYNGKSVICRDGETENLASDFEETYLKTDTRPKELSDFSYNMLCFIHDYIYGHPGYYGFADTNKDGYCDASDEAANVKEADNLNFDLFIQRYAPDVYTGLKSSSNTEYVKALHRLIVSVYGDGHTAMQPPKVSSIEGLANYKLESDKYSGKIVVQQVTAAGILRDEANCPRRNTQAATLTEGERKFTLPGADSTGESNLYVSFSSDFKTAVIHFDKFIGVSDDWVNTKYAAWKEYRAGGSTGTKPAYPLDTLGLFYFAFDKIEELEASGKTIENVVIDVSANGGGAVLEVGTLLSFLLSDGNTKVVLTDVEGLSNAEVKTVYTIDLNLDGKIDETDTNLCKTRKNKYKYAVLASQYTWSSANLFTVMAKNYGLKIIGERTLGGSCSVAYFESPEGISYCLSISLRGKDLNGSYLNIENGATVDKPVLTEKLSTANISQFYDEDKIGAAVTAAYGN